MGKNLDLALPVSAASASLCQDHPYAEHVCSDDVGKEIEWLSFKNNQGCKIGQPKVKVNGSEWPFPLKGTPYLGRIDFIALSAHNDEYTVPQR